MDSKVQNQSIIFFTRSLEVGGAERQIVELSNGLMSHMKVTILTMYPLVPLAKQLDSQVKLIQLEKKSRWDILGFFTAFIGVIKSEKPTYFYSFLVIPNILSLLVKVFSSNTKLIWSIRAADMNLSMYDRFSNLTFKLQNILSKYSDLVISNSECALKYHKTQGFRSKKEVVIANGLDLEKFYRVNPEAFIALHHLNQNVFTIGIVGRLDPVKDHPLFFKILREYKKTKHFQILVVGDGNKDYYHELKLLVKEYSLHDQVIWVPKCLDMKSAYSSMDLLLLTSQSESFPNVLIEAMACETLVLAKDVGDARVIVGDDRYICDSDQVKIWIEKIDRLIKSDITGKCLRDRVAKYFSNKQMIQNTLQAI